MPLLSYLDRYVSVGDPVIRRREGQVIEQRSWPTLRSTGTVAAGTVMRGQQFVDGEGMAVMPDGRHAVLGRAAMPFGVRDDSGFYSLELSPLRTDR